MEIILKMITTVIGSAIGSLIGHRLSLKAQDRAFYRQVMNEAKGEIVNSLEEYQKWLNEITEKTDHLYDELYSTKESSSSSRLIEEYLKLLNQPYATSVDNTLRKHKYLFKKCHTYRTQLMEQHEKIIRMLLRYSADFGSKPDKTLISDQIALTDEAIRYFQEKVLNGIGRIKNVSQKKDCI